MPREQQGKYYHYPTEIILRKNNFWWIFSVPAGGFIKNGSERWRLTSETLTTLCIRLNLELACLLPR